MRTYSRKSWRFVFALAGVGAMTVTLSCLDFDEAYKRYCETHDCPCENGETLPCYTGPKETRNVGSCKDGVRTCVNGQFANECTSQVLPQTADLCDGKDDNCDGKINARETSAEFCARYEKTCGLLTAIDNCGTLKSYNCGTCIGLGTCGGGGNANVCGCDWDKRPQPRTSEYSGLPDKKDGSIYIVSSGEVRDLTTCLIWKQYPLTETDASGYTSVSGYEQYYWPKTASTTFCALDACSQLGNGWRLPTYYELRSIVDTTTLQSPNYPTINRQIFPNTPASYFWSTSTCADVACTPTPDVPASVAWAVEFGHGSSQWWSGSVSFVRCVR